jgi:hypothetical protein
LWIYGIGRQRVACGIENKVLGACIIPGERNCGPPAFISLGKGGRVSMDGIEDSDDVNASA